MWYVAHAHKIVTGRQQVSGTGGWTFTGTVEESISVTVDYFSASFFLVVITFCSGEVSVIGGTGDQTRA